MPSSHYTPFPPPPIELFALFTVLFTVLFMVLLMVLFRVLFMLLFRVCSGLFIVLYGMFRVVSSLIGRPRGFVADDRTMDRPVREFL